MKNLNTHQKGGLVIQKEEIESILSKPGTEGIAFMLPQVGRAKNVDLIIMRVYKIGNELHAEPSIISEKKAAPSALSYPYGNPQNYKFRQRAMLKSCGFSFGFYSKESFALLLREEWDEVFIGGGRVRYPDMDFMDNEVRQDLDWFTFTIAVRRKLDQLVIKEDDDLEVWAKQKYPKAHVNKIQFLNCKGIMNSKELREKNVELFSSKHKVCGLFISENENKIIGLAVTADENQYICLFDKKESLIGIKLKTDQSLKRLVAHEEPETEESLGAFPYVDHCVACPPHWPEDPPSPQMSDNVRIAIQKSVLS